MYQNPALPRVSHFSKNRRSLDVIRLSAGLLYSLSLVQDYQTVAHAASDPVAELGQRRGQSLAR